MIQESKETSIEHYYGYCDSRQKTTRPCGARRCYLRDAASSPSTAAPVLGNDGNGGAKRGGGGGGGGGGGDTIEGRENRVREAR